ncbi:MAG: hypothetical protein IH596_14215 [Bacteroidales bacterium]|nr:hypothetical protein [Bacteroidales bacterium]
MEAFLFDLIKIFLQALFFLALVLTAIWFYFRLRPNPANTYTLPVVDPANNKEVVHTLRLQACERLVLFLERITPNNLLLRVNTPDMSALQLQVALIRTVREEFEYNLSQQLYLTTETWELIRNAKEETIRQINTAASGMKEGSSSRDLAGAILKLSLSQERAPASIAIEAIKREIR